MGFSHSASVSAAIALYCIHDISAFIRPACQTIKDRMRVGLPTERHGHFEHGL
jgi:hypothetical protein